MEILFTGSNGFVGSNIIDIFIGNNNHVYTLSKKNSNYNVDLSTTIPILPIKFDLVIHAAGIAHIVSNTKDLNKYIYETNVNATKNLLKSLDSSHYPASFIFLSSVAVYGLEYGIKIKEANILNGETAYAKSKITCENLIIDWCKKNNVTYTVLRLPLLVGKDPKGNLESLIKSIQKNIYFNISGVNAKKSMLHVNDIYNFIILCYSKGGVYNLTDGVDPNIIEFTNILATKYGKRKLLSLPYILIKFIAKFGDMFGKNFIINSQKFNKLTNSLTFCNTKAITTFNWKPISVLDKIDSTLD